MQMSDGSSTCDKMHDERDDREQEKQMDEHASALEHHKTTQPHHNQNYCEDKKH
jgi:hypothetical protein